MLLAVLLADHSSFSGPSDPLLRGIGGLVFLILVLLSIHWSERNPPRPARR